MHPEIAGRTIISAQKEDDLVILTDRIHGLLWFICFKSLERAQKEEFEQI